MSTSLLIEIFGYIGSVLVVISMLMSSVVKLRVINMIGSIISGIYAFISGALPLFVMNVCLLIINLYNLHKLLHTTKEYDLVDGKSDDAFLAYLLERYREDINIYFPEFSGSMQENDVVYIVCHNGIPAGVLMGQRLKNDVIDVVLDYSTPAYRDCSVGTFLYMKLHEHGVKTLKFAQQKSEAHITYMKKMGFENENGIYVKTM